MPIKSIATPLVALTLGWVSVDAQQHTDPVVAGLNSQDDGQIDKAVRQIRSELASTPLETVDQLNRTWLMALRATPYAAVEEFGG